MKEFFKFTLATIVGIILSSVVMLLVGVMIIVGVVSASDSETQVKGNSILFLDLNGELLERTEDNPLKQFVGESFAAYGLDDVLASIEKAKSNDKIKGIYLQATALSSSYASIEEIRNALLDFKKSGKFIVAYGDVYSQGLYYLASVADKVMLNPQGSVDWKGLASQPIFYKDVLNKLGVEMQVFKVGTYKSAVEPFIATEMSPANREQVTVFMGSIWDKLLSDVSVSRKVTVDSLNSYANKMLMFYPAEESVKCGLADTLAYKDGVRSYLKKLVKVDKDDDLNLLSLEDMINVPKDTPKDKSGNVVAIYYAYGDIDGSSEEGIVSKKVVRDLRKLREDEKVKAVVLRVNSPGGSAFGSEQIWHEVVLLKAKKPVIVSMGDYAASGGYYIACAADYILAQPTTLTGSIGIFGMFPNVKGLADKIGLGFDVVKTNKYSDFGAMGRGLNADEQSLLQMNVNNGYKLFIKRCADGRKMKTTAIEKIAEGRVWTGTTAKQLGLVDSLGGINDALAIAAQRAKLKDYTVVSYPVKKDFLSSLLESKTTGYVEAKLKNEFGDYYKGLNLLKNLQSEDFVQARLPFDLNIK